MSVRQITSASSYALGTFLLIPGSILFLQDYSAKATTGVYLYIAACSFLVLASLIDLFAFLWTFIFTTPSSLSSTPLLNDPENDLQPKNSFFALITNHSFLNAVAMVIGGLLFLIASVLYLYSNLVETGTWVFRFGSVSYFAGTSLSLVDLIKASQHENELSTSTLLWILVCLQFLCGSCMFVTGGILSQLSHSGSAVCWLIGSILFFTGAACMVVVVLRTYFFQRQSNDGNKV
jgi:hypothetical protein